MSNRLNPRQEAFALARFKGLKVVEAYVAAGYKGNETSAKRLHRRPKIQARIKELNDAAAKLAVYQKADAIRDVVAIIRALPSQAGPDNPLCRKHVAAKGDYYTFPDKLDAIARLAKMMNWDEVQPATAVDLDNPDSMKACLARIRSRK